MGVSPKLQRWIDLMAALLDRRYGLSLAELRIEVPGYRAGRPESVRRTFERDKDELRRLGVPIDIVGRPGDPDPRYRLAGDRFYLPYLVVAGERGLVRPRRIDRDGYRAIAECEFDDEAVALLADAARRVSEIGDPMLVAYAQSAVRKLATDIAPEFLAPTQGVRVLPAIARASPEHLEVLGAALLHRKQASFTYYGIERDETERRTVLPYGLAFTSGHWYLHALDPARGEIRGFRVSRMRELSVNARAPGTQDYEIPATFSLADRAAPRPAWELGEEAPVEVLVRFEQTNGYTTVARRLGQRREADMACYSVRRREPFLRWLLALAGDVVPLSPPDMVREYHALVQRTLKAGRAVA